VAVRLADAVSRSGAVARRLVLAGAARRVGTELLAGPGWRCPRRPGGPAHRPGPRLCGTPVCLLRHSRTVAVPATVPAITARCATAAPSGIACPPRLSQG